MGLVTPLERLLTVPRLREHAASGRIIRRAAVLRLVDEPVTVAPRLVPARGRDGYQRRDRVRVGLRRRVGGAPLRDQPPMVVAHPQDRVVDAPVPPVVVVPTFLVLGSWWQQILRDLIGMPRTEHRSIYILVLLIAVAIALALVAIGRGLRWATNRLTDFGGRVVPGPVARLVAVVIVVTLVVMGLDGALHRGLLSMAERSAKVAGTSTAEGVTQP